MRPALCLLLPDNDDAILALGDTPKDYQSLLSAFQDFVSTAKEACLYVYYDSENIEKFLAKAAVLNSDPAYLISLKSRLRNLAKGLLNLKSLPKPKPPFAYYRWDASKVTVHLLTQALPRLIQLSQEKQQQALLANLFHIPHYNRPGIYLIQEEKWSKPPQFHSIPQFIASSKLQLWLTKNPPSFSLENNPCFKRIKETFQGAQVYQKSPSGQFWYLDQLHKDHYEVFDAQRRHLGTADLQGRLNRSKRKKGRSF